MIGGCGHVGLPLAIAFAERGLTVGIYDLNEDSVSAVNAAEMPFRGLDYERIRLGLADGYPRAADLPSAGFTAGPCLFKDTMQLRGVQQQQHQRRAGPHRDDHQRGPAAVPGAPP